MPGCARYPWGQSTSGRRVQAVGVAEEPRFERVGAVQASGNACEDQCRIGGAEAGYHGAGVGEGAPPDRGGEFLAVVDQLADEVDEPRRAAGLGGWIRGVGRCRHGRNKNMRRRHVSRNIFLRRRRPRLSLKLRHQSASFIEAARATCSPSLSSSGAPSVPGCAPFVPAFPPPNSSSLPRYAKGCPNFSSMLTKTTSSRNSSPNDRTPTKCRPSASPPKRKPRTHEQEASGRNIVRRTTCIPDPTASIGHVNAVSYIGCPSDRYGSKRRARSSGSNSRLIFSENGRCFTFRVF